MSLISLLIGWSAVNFVVAWIWSAKREKLGRKYGGYRKFVWGTASGYVRIDW